MSWLPLGAGPSGPWRVESGVWALTSDGGQLTAESGGTPRPGGSFAGGNYACISRDTAQPAADITVASHRDTQDGYGGIFFAMDDDPETGRYLRLRYDGGGAFELDVRADLGYGIGTYYVDEIHGAEWYDHGDTVLHVVFDPDTVSVTLHQDGAYVGAFDVAVWAAASGFTLPTSWGTRVGLGGTIDSGISSVSGGEVWSNFTATGQLTAAGPWLPLGPHVDVPSAWIPLGLPGVTAHCDGFEAGLAAWWTAVPLAVGDPDPVWDVDNGRAYVVSGAGGLVVDVGSDTYTLDMTVTRENGASTPVGSFAGPLIRYDDPANYLYFHDYQLIAIVAGTETVVAEGPDYLSGGAVVHVDVTPTHVTMTVGGVTWIDVDDATATSSHLAGLRGNATTSTARFDDFCATPD